MSDTNPPDATQTAEQDAASVVVSDVESEAAESDTDAFPREYVEKIRRESASYRDRAKAAEARADELAARLHAALVTATGKLADPSDLAFDSAHLDDVDQLDAAIDALIDAKPHLKSRSFGSVGQGQRSNDTGPQDFSALFR
jgi:hypothetical protein